MYYECPICECNTPATAMYRCNGSGHLRCEYCGGEGACPLCTEPDDYTCVFREDGEICSIAEQQGHWRREELRKSRPAKQVQREAPDLYRLHLGDGRTLMGQLRRLLLNFEGHLLRSDDLEAIDLSLACRCRWLCPKKFGRGSILLRNGTRKSVTTFSRGFFRQRTRSNLWGEIEFLTAGGVIYAQRWDIISLRRHSRH
jgi:hypothetical protein